MEWVRMNDSLITRPMVIVVHLHDYELQQFEQFLHNPSFHFMCSERIRFVVYVSDYTSIFYVNFPINILRNVGIRSTRTTHFVFLDFDMWPSGIIAIIQWNLDQSFETLRDLPKAILQDRRAVIVIPAFFHKKWKIANGTLEDQFNSYRWYLLVRCRIKHKIPFTMNQLLDCVKEGGCHYIKENLFNHVGSGRMCLMIG